MLTAKESSEMLKNMSASERLEALKHKVGEKTKNALDAKIRETVATYEKDISIVLGADICTDKDDDIRGLLKALGYTKIKVSSDFPSYGDDYTGSTTIKFSIPD